MAKETPLEWRNLNIYSIFLRNFSKKGTFNAVHSELDRIKHLGTDVIWFLPFYPIGELNRKGSVGSPYAIKDFRAIDPAIGTLDDFKLLVQEIHKREMKVMIDIVFNHTAPDSVLAQEHPEWFYRKADGSMGNRVGEWTDIVDLDYSNKELWDYQLETLVQWAEIVDGFRCDVAPLIPIDFWKEARARVNAMKPNFIWLSETVEPHFIKHLRERDLIAHSDAEVYEAFDLTYAYDVFPEFQAYLAGEIPLSDYVGALNRQETIYPSNYVKLRFLENHDQDRIVNSLVDIEDLVEWTAFNYFQKGATLVYNGQEVGSKRLPNLFEKDPIDWVTGIDLSMWLQSLVDIKKEHVPVENIPYHLEAIDELDTVIMTYDCEDSKKIGVFNLKHHEAWVPLKVPDGEYYNLVKNRLFEVVDGKVSTIEAPIFFTIEK